MHKPRAKIALRKPEEIDVPSAKKRRVDKDKDNDKSNSSPVKEESDKQPGKNNLGSLIGRKRKERKGGKKGGR